MKRYWFEFDAKFGDKNFPYAVSLGCGITAYNYDDAINLLSEKIFNGKPLPRISNMIENIDVSTLDAGHILPNMAPPNFRGIWFPLGYNY